MESPSVRAARGAAPIPFIVPVLDVADADLAALERMLLELAVHRDGAGASGAWLLVWDSRRGLMEGWRSAAATDGGERIEDALGRARRTPPGEDERRSRAWAEEPEALEGVLAEAWRGSTTAFGADAAQSAAPWGSAPAVGAIALRRGAHAFGMIVTAWPPGADDAASRERLDALRHAANAALDAQQRAERARRRAKQLEALAELGRAAVSSINLAEALHLVARVAVQATGTRGAAVYRAHGGHQAKLAVAYGPNGQRDAMASAFAPLATAVIASGHARTSDAPEADVALDPAVDGDTSAWAVVPLAAYARVQGALAVADGLERHPAEPALEREDLAFLAQLADHVALLLAHAEASEALRRGEQRLGEQAERLHELDRLAAIGEMASRVARESQNPLTSIGAFARRAQRETGEEDPRREYLEIVVRETERLEAMLQEQRAYAQLERGRLRMQNLNHVVQEALLRASETIVRRRVRLLKKLASDLPELLLDETRIRRVVENVVAHALECVPVGGRIKVESRRAGEWVAVEIAHDGARSGGDLMEQLFVPFAAGPAGGAAVGLGVAQQIVREHGGEVRVRSEGEWSTVFSFTLPVRGNEDRRRRGERRGVRSERRRGSDRGESGGGGV